MKQKELIEAVQKWRSQNMNPRTIDIITNVVAGILAVAEPLNAYFTTQPFDLYTFGVTLMGAIVAFLTGKSARSLQK